MWIIMSDRIISINKQTRNIEIFLLNGEYKQISMEEFKRYFISWIINEFNENLIERNEIYISEREPKPWEKWFNNKKCTSWVSYIIRKSFFWNRYLCNGLNRREENMRIDGNELTYTYRQPYEEIVKQKVTEQDILNMLYK